MNEELIEIKDLIYRSKDLKDLQNQLTEKGHTFSTTQNLIKFLKESWIKSNETRIKQIMEEPLSDIEQLPYTEIERNGITYKIHGRIHSHPLTGTKLGYRTKAFYKEKIKKQRKLPEEDYILEYGFSKELGLGEPENNNYYIKALKRLTEEQYQKLRDKASKYEELNLDESDFKSGRERLETSDDIERQFGRYNYLTLKDPRYLLKSREVNTLSNLPEPLNIELSKLSNNITDLLCTYLSEEMANFMIEYAESNRLKILHANVGLSHETEIACFLKNR